MILDSFPTLLALAVFAGLAAATIVYGLGRALSSGRATARALTDAAGAGTVFLFEDQVLVDATQPARRLLGHKEHHQTDWQYLFAMLSRRFPDFPQGLADLAATGQVSVLASQGGETLRADYCEGLLRITMDTRDTRFDTLAVSAMEEELERLRSIAEDAPQLIWKENAAGDVIWANKAYLVLTERLFPTPIDSDPIWHSRPVLDLSDQPGPDLDNAPVQCRVSLRVPGAETLQWFEVTSVRRGAEIIRFAVDANSAVKAETARRVFVQTLTNTFAHLSTGLAVFDRQRRLVLFNPAFLDLTGLSAGFLSSRPLVATVLDKLRDMHMLPEPKNYATWRDQVTAFESQAAEGTYCETWSLPSGLTYRVTGRPHPEGAIAFLFEDISDEIALTRRYRSDQETAQAVLDSLDDAIAVFSAGGTLIMFNALYQATFGSVGQAATAEALDDMTLEDQIRRWQALAQPNPVWDEVRRFLRGKAERVEWRGNLHLQDGRPVALCLTPLGGGAVVARFRSLASDIELGMLPAATARSGRHEDGDAAFRSTRRAAVAAALASDPLPAAPLAVRAAMSPASTRQTNIAIEADARPASRRRGKAPFHKSV